MNANTKQPLCATDVELRVIDDPEALYQMRNEWNDLVERCQDATIFSTWEWQSSWWRHLAGKRGLEILALYSQGRLLAVAPFCRRSSSLGSFQPFPCSELLAADTSGADYLDVLCEPAFEEPFLARIATELGNRRSIIALSRVGMGARVLGPVATTLEREGWSWYRQSRAVCPFIDLHRYQSWDDYLKSRSRRSRAAFSRKFRRLEKNFQVSFRRAGSEEERRSHLALLMRLHEQRWAGREEDSSAFDTPQLRDFHEQVTRLSWERDWLRLYLLQVNGIPAAAVYGYRFRDVFYYFQSGMDPRFGGYGVGTVAVGLAVRSAFEDGCTGFDFLHGDEKYKMYWADLLRPISTLVGYPPGFKGLLQREAALVYAGARRVLRESSNALGSWRRAV